MNSHAINKVSLTVSNDHCCNCKSIVFLQSNITIELDEITARRTPYCRLGWINEEYLHNSS
uniref:Uncharacterized protein n=1 Tax=Manihot esculenta TaxID=3983 RepID=A0A2C9W3X5_MANES